ncbi:uncharacterized protein LOC121782722 isoform X1 [Salvia splendens]|uniref:uncharacterized protein LOC121782722 isoform X1 n=2 Tax=Salvia splendens TaxID=180675 RepID=UPI001104857A|nr:uncharacterized protein LOC121782722 isoform X1 [Salvia splendens]
MSDQESLRDGLFKLTMQQKWEEVAKIYKENRNAHTLKLTKLEDTAFHIAISCYNPKSPNYAHERCTKEMFTFMKECGSVSELVRMHNVKGDTPLHLAAAAGWEAICRQIALVDTKLIDIRNSHGETPLFVSALHGNLQTFISLHGIYNHGKDKGDESLCRRKDGNTVLHSAISGEYFRLAYFILEHYKNLLNYVNVDGETPLHVLARKPNLFKSSSQLGFYESIIYHFVFVDNLKNQQIHNPKDTQIDDSSEENFPENYQTCMRIFRLLWDPISKSYKAGCLRSEKEKTDPEDPPYMEHGVPIHESFLGGCSRSKIKIPPSTNETKVYDSYPPNYTTCISIFKFATMVILTILGVGFLKIRKIHDKRVRHSHAMQIMDKMIEIEPSYKYDNNGQRPSHLPEAFGNIPDIPPNAEEPQTTESNSPTISSSAKDQQQNNGSNDKKDQNQSGDEKSKSVVKDTPLLVAAKMGIPEMVKKILSAVPVAIQDQDSEGKNVLMVAAEHRQTSVFDFLLQKKLPDYVFHHFDNEGNNILHLAAKLGEKQPWRIPGAALQMQWEIKWYKYVKSSAPAQCYNHPNTKGETPAQIFTQTHENLVKTGNDWLVKTSESCSVVAALIATVAFATSATVPGGLDQNQGFPIMRDRRAFDVFSIASLIALCLSITALVFFLAIITSRFEERDFKQDLPRKLLMGMSCLFSGIAAMLLSFCAGHTFILREKLRIVAMPIYAVAMFPVVLFAIGELPLYFDILWAAYVKVPLRSYNIFHR